MTNDIDKMHTLFLNNMLRLQWEHTVQFVEPFDMPPRLPQFYASEIPLSCSYAINRARSIVHDMSEQERTRKKQRIVGVALVYSDLEYRRLLNDRSATREQWMDFCNGLGLLSYERCLCTVDPSSWLPVEPPPIDDPAFIYTEINRRVDGQRRQEAEVNKRDQLAIAKMFLANMILLCEQKGFEIPPIENQESWPEELTEIQVFQLNVDNIFDRMIEAVNSMSVRSLDTSDGHTGRHLILRDSVTELLRTYQTNTNALVAEFVSETMNVNQK